MRLSRLLPVLLIIGGFTASGCGSGPKLGEVEGTVKVNGKALDKIQVEFWPLKSGPRSIGVTDDQGKFTLTTDDGKQKGAVVGPHKVVLIDSGVLGDKFLGRAGEDVDMAKGKKPRTAAIFTDPHKTTIEKSVIEGKNQIDIVVGP